MRDIFWWHGEWMNKLVTAMCWWYNVTSLIWIHKNRCPLLHRYTGSLSDTSRVILRYFWNVYINRITVHLYWSISRQYTLSHREHFCNNTLVVVPTMNCRNSSSDLALLRGEVFAVFGHVFAVSRLVVVTVLPLLAWYIIRVIIAVVTRTSAVYRMRHPQISAGNFQHAVFIFPFPVHVYGNQHGRC